MTGHPIDMRRQGPASAVPIAVVVAAIACAGAGCGDSAPDATTARGTTLAQISDQRGKFVGDEVTVSGRIDEVVNQRLFVVSRTGAPWTRVAVLADKPLRALRSSEPPSDGQAVEVTGVLDAVDIRELRRDGGYFGAYAERVLADRALIRASDVTISPGAPSDDVASRTTPADVLRSPGRHLGELTTIEGRADRAFGGHAFTIDGLLVVSRLESTRSVQAGDFVEVTGPVRRFDRVRFEGGTGVELPESLSRFAGEPALHADIVNYAIPPPHRFPGTDPRQSR